MKMFNLMVSLIALSMIIHTACAGDDDDDNDLNDDTTLADDTRDDADNDDDDSDDVDDAGDDSSDDAVDDSSDDTSITDDTADDTAVDDTVSDDTCDDTDDDDTGSLCESPQLRFSDNFDSDTAGGLPDPIWDDYEPEGVVIYDGDSHSFPNSMRLWTGSDRAGKYIWYSPISMAMPAETCDIVWVELWGKVFWDGDELFNIYIFNESDGYDLVDGLPGSGETWHLYQVKVDLVAKTLDYFVDGTPYGDQVVLAHTPDTIMILAMGLSDGTTFSPGSLIDDFAVYDEGY